MRLHRGFRLVLLVILILILAGCSSSSPVQEQKVPAKNRKQVNMQHQIASVTPSAQPDALPERLVIHAIQLNTHIEAVGVTASGDLAVPAKDPWVDAGWYESGPRPGETGSAVIDGHLDRPGGYPAVFWNLRLLHAGDEVQVIDTQGKVKRFRVTAIVYYQPQTAPIQEIFANTSGKFLNLITCAGDWIPDQHQTTLRLVVYTSLE